MLRLRPDPVPDALIRHVLEAGTWAASDGNMQSRRLLLVRDWPRYGRVDELPEECE